jgi:two-component system sensor kinase FixL
MATAADRPLPGAAAKAEGSRRLAIVAGGEDLQLILELLGTAGFECAPAALRDVAAGIVEDDLAAAVLTEEMLRSADLRELEAAVEGQPPWSDIPFVLVAEPAAMEGLSGTVRSLGRVALVERPIRPIMLRNAVEAALRARSRQRQAVSFLLQRQDAEENLRQLTSTLEKRVRERMRDLRASNQRLVQEIHERHATEERLRESEELYRYTVELSRQMVWTATPEGRLVTVNRRFYDVTGTAEEVQPHEGWLNAVHEEDRPHLMRYWSDALASGRPHHAEFRMRIADGSYRTFVARAAPRFDEEGRIIRWYGFTEDVTEHKHANAARREAEERYRLAAKATNDAIWDLDVVAGRIQWTASETAFFGYPDSEEMTSLDWWEERIHPEDRARVARSLDTAIAGSGTRWEEPYRFLTARGGYADAVDRGFIIRNEAGETVRMVGAMSDLTDFRRAEAEIRSMQAELIHVSRLSAMGTMASTLAHELNQPLTAVSSYIRGSRRRLDQQEGNSLGEVREALEAAENAALRAGHLVKRLRELVAKGNVSPRPEQLAKVIQDASLIAFLDEHLLGVTHRIEFDPKAEWVEVDPIQIQQVVINLVRNALQAMEGQARREVVIRTRLVSKGTAEVSVADTGTGIPAEIREALFSPFQSTRVEGMGIGLSISRTIIEAHGGRIWAEDAPDGGTIFRFTLPRVPDPELEPSGTA